MIFLSRERVELVLNGNIVTPNGTHLWQMGWLIDEFRTEALLKKTVQMNKKMHGAYVPIVKPAGKPLSGISDGKTLLKKRPPPPPPQQF